MNSTYYYSFYLQVSDDLGYCSYQDLRRICEKINLDAMNTNRSKAFTSMEEVDSYNYFTKELESLPDHIKTDLQLVISICELEEDED